MEIKQTSITNHLFGNNALSKTEAERIAQIIINEFEFGKINSFEYLARLEFISQCIDKAKENIRESVLNELDKYPERKTGITFNGVKFKEKETGIKYDYSKTELWNRMKSELDQMNENIKAFESQLKSLRQSQTIVDETTGEIHQLNPPVKSSKTSIEITLPK